VFGIKGDRGENVFLERESKGFSLERESVYIIYVYVSKNTPV